MVHLYHKCTIILYNCRKELGRSVCTNTEKCKLRHVIAHYVEYDSIYLKTMWIWT